MKITYADGKYVSSTGKQVSPKEYGFDFNNCPHKWSDTGRRGYTIGGNGKKVNAKALQCLHCSVYMVVEIY